MGDEKYSGAYAVGQETTSFFKKHLKLKEETDEIVVVKKDPVCKSLVFESF
jgi:hypothetical protein